MTVKDFLKRIDETDYDKMMIWVDLDGVGWANIAIEKTDFRINILPDPTSPFTDGG